MSSSTRISLEPGIGPTTEATTADVDEWTSQEAWAAAWLGFLFFVSTAENILLLLVFFKRPCMRTLSNRLVGSLVVANLVFTLVVVPLIVLDMVAWSSMPGITCHFLNGLIFMVAATSVSCSLTIHIDRYLAVLDPLRYRHRITRQKVNAMIAATWGLSAALSVLDTVVAPVEWDWNVCAASGGLLGARVSWTIRGAYVMFILVTLFLVPFFTQAWIYWRIYVAARNNSKRTRRSSSTTTPSSSVPSTPFPEAIQGDCPLMTGFAQVSHPHAPPILLRQNSFAQFVLHRLSSNSSGASSTTHKEEGRTAAFSLAIMLTSFICWAPFFAHILFEWVWSGAPEWFHRSSIFALLAFTTISPVLYGFHSHRTRKELARLFRHTPPFVLDSIQRGSSSQHQTRRCKFCQRFQLFISGSHGNAYKLEHD